MFKVTRKKAKRPLKRFLRRQEDHKIKRAKLNCVLSYLK